MDTDPDRIRVEIFAWIRIRKNECGSAALLKTSRKYVLDASWSATTYQELATCEGILVKAGVHFTGRIMDWQNTNTEQSTVQGKNLHELAHVYKKNLEIFIGPHSFSSIQNWFIIKRNCRGSSASGVQAKLVTRSNEAMRWSDNASSLRFFTQR